MVRLLIALALLLPLAGGEAAEDTMRRKGRCRKCACGAFVGPGVLCKRTSCRHPDVVHKFR